MDTLAVQWETVRRQALERIATAERERDALRQRFNGQRDAIHEALAMVAAMRHERDEARAQLAALCPTWRDGTPACVGWYWVRGASGQSPVPIYRCKHGWCHTAYSARICAKTLEWAGPLPEPKETP